MLPIRCVANRPYARVCPHVRTILGAKDRTTSRRMARRAPGHRLPDRLHREASRRMFGTPRSGAGRPRSRVRKCDGGLLCPVQRGGKRKRRVRSFRQGTGISRSGKPARSERGGGRAASKARERRRTRIPGRRHVRGRDLAERQAAHPGRSARATTVERARLMSRMLECRMGPASRIRPFSRSMGRLRPAR